MTIFTNVSYISLVLFLKKISFVLLYLLLETLDNGKVTVYNAISNLYVIQKFVPGFYNRTRSNGT